MNASLPKQTERFMMPHPLHHLCLFLFSTVCLCADEPRIWTSTSGSTIEANYLGSFGDELWFEGAKPQRRLLKMPSKYISAADLALIEANEVDPLIEHKSIDTDEASLSLLEQLFKTKVTEAIQADQSLENALDALLGEIPSDDETEIVIKFHRKVDEDTTRTDPINEPTIYTCLLQLADVHAFKWSIRKGVLTLRPR